MLEGEIDSDGASKCSIRPCICDIALVVRQASLEIVICHTPVGELGNSASLAGRQSRRDHLLLSPFQQHQIIGSLSVYMQMQIYITAQIRDYMMPIIV